MRGFCPRRMVLVFLCFNLLVFSATAFPEQLLFRPNGSDSNDGSQARPWRTISHADAALTVGGASTTCSAASGWYSQPGYGACVHIAPGTYSIGSELITNKSGASSNQRVGFVSDTRWVAGSTEFRRIFRHLFGPRRMVGHYRI